MTRRRLAASAHRQRGGFALRPAGAVAGSTAGAASFRGAVLPWTTASADERRFQGILMFCVAAAVLAALALRAAVLPAPDLTRVPTLPPPMARLILERAAPPADRPRAPPIPARAPASPQPSSAKPGAAPPARADAQSAVQAAAATSNHTPADVVAAREQALDKARRSAAAAGLLALRGELAAMAAAPAAVQVLGDASMRPRAGQGGTAAGAAGPSTADPVLTLLSDAAARTSGSHGADRGGSGSGSGNEVKPLASRATTALANAASGAPAARNDAANGRVSPRPTRSIEDVRLVFDRQKGAIHALYQRALRDDPALQGKVVVELKIAPGGQVEWARIVSSDMHAEEFERKLLARIRQFDFGTREVDALVLSWPLDFLPG